jgi:hypothetical protein
MFAKFYFQMNFLCISKLFEIKIMFLFFLMFDMCWKHDIYDLLKKLKMILSIIIMRCGRGIIVVS